MIHDGCVTYVPGQTCYLCPRPNVSEATLISLSLWERDGVRSILSWFRGHQE